MITKVLQHFRIEHHDEDRITVWVDVADRSVNVFSDSVIIELENVVDTLESDPVRLVAFRSAKESGFFAGADVLQISQLKGDEEVDNALLRGQKLFDRIHELSATTVAVIHGPCLGGGLEFALACDFRIALDSRSTRLGLPEIQLGLIPGWGGTQRLPKLIGVADALTLILNGKKLSAKAALKLGVVDAVGTASTWDSDVTDFLAAADRDATALCAKRPFGLKRRMTDSLLRWLVFRTAESKVASRADNYPALPAAIRAVGAAFDSTVNGFAAERKEFAHLIETPTCRNLLNLFCRRERARNLQPADVTPDQQARIQIRALHNRITTETRPVRRIGVIGAGAMGAGIGQLAALKGIEVVLKELNQDLANEGKARVVQLLDDMVSKRKLSAAERTEVLSRVLVTDSYDNLADCDVVVEAVVEKMEVKKAVFAALDTVLKPDAVIASNTSALSITEMAGAVRLPNRVAGLHFFNPVHRMELVEVIRTNQTDDATVSSLLKLTKILGKTPVVTADSPGFLVNRVLFPYVGEAVRMVLEGAGCEQIDREAKRFGMPMGPLELLDHVGLDVAWHVAETLREVHPESGELIRILGQMVARGWTGVKADRGFYNWRSGRRAVNPDLSRLLTSFELQTPDYAALQATSNSDCVHNGVGVFISDGLSETQRRLIYPMINEAAMCVEEAVVSEPWMADLAMVLGTGFAPFRGGPISFAESVSRAALLNNFQVLAARHGHRFKPAAWLVTRQKSPRSEHQTTEKH